MLERIVTVVGKIEGRDGLGAAIDRAGMALSVCCGLHCIATPLLLGAAVGLPFGWLFAESAETLLLTAAIGTAALSLGPSYWRRHRHKRCLGLFAMGAILLAAAKLGPVSEALEPITVASGAALIATAHLVNLRLCRQCALCEAEEPAA
ncbi:MAG: MerC domain-containing protein [Acidobacteriia bacterium]|nr:MerC domain-containing protein [Terriglobia bacterium]MYG00707.1 MerC domain-containing protein [Terriglobia bacterium]MYK10268.1 MerC domain-containing protein [Terriglobia bacterium]